jgi:uncharacterized membrane protein
MHYEQSIDIAAPPDVVWRVLADVEGWPEWTRSIRSARLIDTDTLARGARAKLGVAGAQMETVWEVTALDAGQSFVWESRQPGIRNVAGHYIEPRVGGSTVRLTIDMSGFAAAVLRPYLAYVTGRNLRWETAGLKQRSETLAQAPLST